MKEQDLALIDRYLQQAASPEEVAQVERRMAQDPAFAQQVELIKEMSTALSQPTAAFRGRVQAAMEAIDREEKTSSLQPRWGYAVAAAVALLVVVGLYLTFRSGKPDYAQLAENTFAAPPSPFLQRDTARAQQPLLQGAEAYEQGDYHRAIVQWQQVPADHPRYGEVRLYLGISELANGQPQAAIQGLTPLLQAPQPELQQSAQWYLALAWLRQQEPQQVLPLLRELASGRSSFATRAQKLLAEIE